MLKTAQSQLTPITLNLFSNKTRDLILESSLVLFNDLGFKNVTTSSIANKTGILEGTLWYHFNTKKDILSAHIQLLEQIFFSKNLSIRSKPMITFMQSLLIIMYQW